jgi:hypothetical protein
MGFIQKLATISDRVRTNPQLKVKHAKDCDCKYYYNKVKPPKLTWRYILNLKNWK